MEASQRQLFSSERVFMLIRRFFFMRKKMLVVGMAISICILAILGLLSLIGSSPDQFIQKVFVRNALSIMTFVGAALSSVMFSELNSSDSAVPYITLPVSSAEKLIAAGLMIYIGYTIVGLTIVYFFSLVIGLDFNSFFAELTPGYLLNYLSFQTIFLFGSAFFRSNNFLSTLLSVMLFFAAIALISVAIANLYQGPLVRFGNPVMDVIETFRNSTILMLLFHLGLSGLFLGLTYRRLQTRQIA